MIKRSHVLLLAAVVFAVSVCPAPSGADEYHYGVEMNGVLCGYATLDTSPVVEDGRILGIVYISDLFFDLLDRFAADGATP